MKKRIALLILAIVCFAGVLALTASADGEPATAIPGHNLALEDCVNIIYYAEFENVPAEAETGVLVWTSAQDSYAYGKEEAKLVANGTYDQYDKFFYGVPAKMMSQDIYAVSYIKDGEEITYSELDKYSVLQYAYNKKGSTTTFAGGTITLGDFLVDMLNYGTSAQKLYGYNLDRLANATYYEITVAGGTLPDGTTKGLYKAGASVTLNATIENFDHWENAVGDTVANPITVVGVDTYTAVAIRYSEGLEFTSNGNGTCYVAGIGTCTDLDVIIPPYSPEGDRVTIIGEHAFYSCTSLTSVTFAEGSQLTSIEEGAFRGCTSLTSITIPASVTSIGEEVFYKCTSMTSITIPEGVTSIGGHAFSYCISLTSITIPEGVTSIGNGAFHNCSGLTSVIFAEDSQLTSIGNYAFEYCSNLTSIDIPEGIISIGWGAFYNCGNLTSITISESVTVIEGEAFYSFVNSSATISVYYLGDLSGWLGITIGESNGSSAFSRRYDLYINNELITDLVIPDAVEQIGMHAFQGCSSLTSVTTGNGVTSIGELAFSGCIHLQSALFGSSVQNIGRYIFSGCNNLSSLQVVEDNTYLYSVDNCIMQGRSVVLGCKTSIIPEGDGAGEIHEYAFYGVELSSIIIPDGYYKIGSAAFLGSSLTSITIPKSVRSIGENAFRSISITYQGTMEEWEAISISPHSGTYTVHCTDGDITK